MALDTLTSIVEVASVLAMIGAFILATCRLLHTQTPLATVSWNN